MKKPIALALLVVVAAIALGCDGAGGTSLVTGPTTAKGDLPQAPAVPTPE